MPHYLLTSEKLPGSHEHLSSQSSHYPRLASERLQDILNGFQGLLTLSTSASYVLTFIHITPLPTIINGSPSLSG